MRSIGSRRGERLAPAFERPTFKEFVVRDRRGTVAELLASACDAGFLAGLPLGRWYPELDDCFLVAVTEKRTRAEIDRWPTACSAIVLNASTAPRERRELASSMHANLQSELCDSTLTSSARTDAKSEATQLLFELSKPGRRGVRLAGVRCAVAAARRAVAGDAAGAEPPAVAGGGRAGRGAALHEPVDAEHVGRYALLSAGVVHDEVQPQAERASGALAGHRRLASPINRTRPCKACCRLLFELQQMLGEISGLPAVSLQPAAGAQGEIDGADGGGRLLSRIAASIARKVLTPDSAHGTNPASARMVGFETVTVKSTAGGHRRSGRPACQAG